MTFIAHRYPETAYPSRTRIRELDRASREVLGPIVGGRREVAVDSFGNSFIVEVRYEVVQSGDVPLSPSPVSECVVLRVYDKTIEDYDLADGGGVLRVDA